MINNAKDCGETRPFPAVSRYGKPAVFGGLNRRFGKRGLESAYRGSYPFVLSSIVWLVPTSSPFRMVRNRDAHLRIFTLSHEDMVWTSLGDGWVLGHATFLDNTV